MNIKSILVNSLVILVILATWGFVIYRFVKAPKEIYWTTLGVILAFVIGFIYHKFRPGKELISVENVKTFLKIIGWLYLNTLLIQVFRYLFHLLEATPLVWLQIFLLLMWGILLFIALLLISIEKKRETLFRWLRKQISGFAPFFYPFTLLYIAIGFFASVTYLLVKNNILLWNTSINQKITADLIGDF
jgi:hypothetical protein